MEKDKQTSSSSESSGSHQERQTRPADWSKVLNQAENAERDSKLRHSRHGEDNAHRVAELVKQAEGGSPVEFQVTSEGIAVGNVQLQHSSDTKCELAHKHGEHCGGE